MIPDNITKEHIEKAITEIDALGIRKGRHSSTYDLVYNGKSYPPKLIISIANRFANGKELDPSTFDGGIGTWAFETLEKLGFSVAPKHDQILTLIENYKKRIAESELKDELYKWELLAQYRGRPDTNATDFEQEIKAVKFGNLIYALGMAVANHIAKDKPEELRALFVQLFDESIDLTTRVKIFNVETLKLYRSLGEKLQHHQDERSIATYLTFHNPDKYTFYKYSFYQKLCKLMGVKEAKKNEKYVHYLGLIQDISDNYIKEDEVLIKQVKSYLPDYYDGTNHNLLVQDILYQMLDQKSDTNYWIFQGNPKAFDFETALNEGLLNDWTVSAHKDKIKDGDKVIVWITGDKAGCYALAEVTSEPYEKETSTDDHLWKKKETSGLKVDIKITHNLIDSPILKQKTDSEEVLKNLKVGNQGTNFSATEDEYSTLLGLINSRESSFEKLISQLNESDLNNYIEFLREILNKFNLKQGDERIVFSTRDNKLNFLIGQRYCWNLFVADKNGKFGIISTDKLKENSGRFDGTDSPYYTHFDDVKSVYENAKSIYSSIELELKRTKKSGFRKSNNIEFENFVFKNEQTKNIDQMIFPLNTILYGPPGTGKTYLTVQRAAEIISDRTIDSYNEALMIFNEHLHKQIEFITFHQNYSYEDFIQGLRPDVETEGDLAFQKVDGVFKKLADRALENLKLSDKAPEEVSKEALFDDALEKLSELVQESEEYIPINDSTYIMDVDDSAFRYSGANWVRHKAGIRMKFSDLKEFYLNDVSDRKEIKSMSNISQLAKQHATYYLLVYKMVLKHLPKKNSTLNGVPKKNYVIVIDEINRANISRVFGELITLIEPDKRSHGAIPLRSKLPSGDVFTVPSNLYIIGTMNTADKSIALLDIALRRRFDFEPMYPNYKLDGIYDVDILEKINKEIIEGKGHDFQIGHAYFMGDNKDLVKRMNKKVIPLLLEYYMNDDKEVTRILTKAGLQVNSSAWPLEITGKA